MGHPMGEPITLSAVVLTKNEEARIVRCLDSLRWVDEIVVVDDESTDRTRQICQQCGATVLVRRSEGDFDHQRNAGIDAAQGEWIFQLDADEVVPLALREEIRRILQRSGDIVAYRVSRVNYFLGHEMRYGGWGWDGVKLFKRSAARYVGHSVHETLAVDGPIGELAPPIWHYPFQSLTQFVERQNFYTTVEARLLREAQPRVSRGRLWYQLVIRPVKLFWKSYVKKHGWREGTYGLVFGALFAWIEFLKWAKYWALGLPSLEPLCGGDEQSSGCPHGGQRGVLPVDGRARLSVVVLTKNEEDKIARCLESVRWADEIVVVDGLSTDRTVEICRQYGATVISRPFSGSFGEERNVGADAASGEWIVQLDGDDVVTEELREAIGRILTEGTSHAAFQIRRKSNFLGHWMMHGGWYYHYYTLYRKSACQFEGRVHHVLKIRGTAGVIEAPILHYPFTSLEQFVARHNRYTSLEAQEMLDTQGVLDRRLVRYQLTWRPLKLFWKSYVKKQGFREGWYGLVFATLYAWVHFLKWAKCWELVRDASPLKQGRRLSRAPTHDEVRMKECGARGPFPS